MQAQDSEAMDEADLTNFSTSSSSHRLPTVSASAALEEANSIDSSPISTGLPTLDELLAPSEGLENASHVRGGLPRGVVTEIYGPPGSGKTALAMQMASNALRKDSNAQVYWVDTGSPIPAVRLKQFLLSPPSTTSGKPPSSPPENSAPVRKAEDLIISTQHFHHIHLFTLPHLLALLLHAVPSFPPPSTSMLVIDNISSLFSTAFPSHANFSQRTISTAARKSAITSAISAALSKLARLHNIAILVVNQTATTAKSASNAGRLGRLSLRPSLGGKEWDLGVGNRCLVYRDFVEQMLSPGNRKHGKKNCRWIEVIKGGRRLEDRRRRRVAFGISDDGVYQLTLANPQTAYPATATPGTPNARVVVTDANTAAPAQTLAKTRTINSAVAQTSPPQKRKRKASDLEIADSQSSSEASSGDNELPRRPSEPLRLSKNESEAKEDEDGDDEYGSFLIGEEDFDFDFEGDVAMDDDDAEEGDERGIGRVGEVAAVKDNGGSSYLLN